MSAVDVLRVMDEAVRFQAYGDELQEARAAVAELIEAAKRVQDKDWEYGEDQPHHVRLNDALARCKGETA